MLHRLPKGRAWTASLGRLGGLSRQAAYSTSCDCPPSERDSRQETMYRESRAENPAQASPCGAGRWGCLEWTLALLAGVWLTLSALSLSLSADPRPEYRTPPSGQTPNLPIY